MEKRQHRCDVPVFGIINFKFVNIRPVVWDLIEDNSFDFNMYTHTNFRIIK